MDDPQTGLMNRDVQGHWIRLETLTRVRWLAATGQIVALAVAAFWLELQLPLLLCLTVVAVSLASVVLSRFAYPRTKRLSETEALLTLMFDTAQLALLLFLTGGLNNPFALLMIAPVSIAATALQLRSTLILGCLAVVLTTLLAITHEPLRLRDGTPLMLDDLFRFGFWLALILGIAFIGLYSRSVASQKHALAEALLATRLALAREQKLTDIGGVVAAAAHELGTPLATIKLVSAELIDTLDGEQAEDARLIRAEADRCRAILQSMGNAARDDLHLRHAPLETVITEAAGPHLDRGKSVQIEATGDEGPMPEIHRRPEIIHGLRNLIQNAVDFAQDTVWIEVGRNGDTVTVRIVDDGPGYPASTLSRIGEPFLRRKRPDTRAGYDGMGLGLFIAKTLLERTGARVSFANCDGSRPPIGFTGSRCGAVAQISWPRPEIEADARRALGNNTPFTDGNGS